MLPPLALVLGGANSGKSRMAEALVQRQGGARHYIATAEPYDDEMRAKIARHRNERGPGWRTHEAPLALAEALAGVPPGAVVLVDCATLWLSNLMLAGGDPDVATPPLLAALAACASPVVVVSNEVGQGIVPDNALARRFRAAQGRLNQALAAEAGLVALAVAGLPLVLKGKWPEGTG